MKLYTEERFKSDIRKESLERKYKGRLIDEERPEKHVHCIR